MSTGPNSTGLIERPAFLPPADPSMMTELNAQAKTPFIKIVQPLSKDPFKPTFADGDVVVFPQLIKIGDKDTPFSYTVLYYHATFAATNPYGIKPWIREISYDANSILAKKASLFKAEKDPQTGKDIEFKKIHNFLIHIFHPELDPDNIYAYSTMKGEAKTGDKLIQLIQRRNVTHFPVCRFRAISSFGAPNHVSKEYTWWGLDHMNDTIPWNTEEEFNKYMEMHNRMKELVDSKAIIYDFETEGGEAGGDNPANESKF